MVSICNQPGWDILNAFLIQADDCETENDPLSQGINYSHSIVAGGFDEIS